MHLKEGYEGQFRFINTLPIYPTILETLGPKEVIYAIPWPPASPLALLKPP